MFPGRSTRCNSTFRIHGMIITQIAVAGLSTSRTRCVWYIPNWLPVIRASCGLRSLLREMKREWDQKVLVTLNIRGMKYELLDKMTFIVLYEVAVSSECNFLF